MVLTNFECWAHGGAVIGNDGLPLNSRHMDMFNPRLVEQRLNTAANGTSSVSHISSNGYYGFSYVNAAHELTDNNSTRNGNNNNPALTQNANNNNTCVPNANDVNGMPSMMHNSMDVGVSAVGAVATGAAGTTVFGTGLNATQRCKKRYFVSDDDYANCALLNGCDSGVAAAAGLDVCASKRCRFDDDYAAAQYCNDFFSLPSTQIGTQSCLMDTEDAQQQQQQQPAAVPQQQQQVDVNMMGVAANFSNQTSNTTTSNIHYTITQQQQQQQLLQQQQQQQQQQVINATNYQQPNVAAQAPPVVVYQQQHNYQGKRNWRTINCDNILINLNETNQNNQQHYNNNQNERHLSGNAATYNPMDCVRSDSVEHSLRSSCEGAAEDFRNNQFGLNKSAKEQTYPISQAKFPAFTSDHHHHNGHNALPGAIVGNSNNEDSAGIAALYATTHGGAFYQYTAAIGGNQTYVEDI